MTRTTVNYDNCNDYKDKGDMQNDHDGGSDPTDDVDSPRSDPMKRIRRPLCPSRSPPRPVAAIAAASSSAPRDVAGGS